MNKVTPRRPSGFPEYLPAEQIEFKRMISAISETYELFGFTPIETPAIELAEVLLAKGGGETEKEIYRFSKGEKDYALHYDLTVPLARYVSEHQSDLVMPFRRYQIQKNWRAERAQKGRFREFLQCDVDVIGSHSVLHDAEIVAVVSEAFSRLAIGDYIIRISNRKLLSGFVDAIDLSDKASDVLHLVDKLEKLDKDALIEEFGKIGLSSDDTQQVIDFVSMSGTPEEVLEQLEGLSIDNKTFLAGIAEMKELLFALKAANVNPKVYSFDLRIVRGLDYYTGTVYETNLVDYPEFGSVCSGGRYNDLTKYYSSADLPGVGISIGLTRLFAAMQEANKIDSKAASPNKILIVQFGGKKVLAKALEVASELRSQKINTQIFLDEAKLDKQFKYADKLGVPYVLVIGDAELESGKVVLKDMSSGDQATLTVKEVLEKLKN